MSLKWRKHSEAPACSAPLPAATTGNHGDSIDDATTLCFATLSSRQAVGPNSGALLLFRQTRGGPARVTSYPDRRPPCRRCIRPPRPMSARALTRLQSSNGVKADDVLVSFDEADLITCTVLHLRSVCRAVGVKPGARNKAELVQAILEATQSGTEAGASNAALERPRRVEEEDEARAAAWGTVHAVAGVPEQWAIPEPAPVAEQIRTSSHHREPQAQSQRAALDQRLGWGRVAEDTGAFSRAQSAPGRDDALEGLRGRNTLLENGAERSSRVASRVTAQEKMGQRVDALQLRSSGGAGTSVLRELGREEATYVNTAEQSRMLRNMRDWHQTVQSKVAGNSSGMAVTWLGTSSGAPSFSRNISSMALRVGDPETILLVDAGEGTQYQFAAYGLDPSAVKQVFLTHHHGDHIFGLPGLINARNEAFAAKGAEPEPLAIYGPPGTSDYVISQLLGVRSYAAAAPRARLRVVDWCLDAKEGTSAEDVDGTDGLVTVARRPPDQTHPRWTARVDVRVIAEVRRPGAYGAEPAVPVCDGLTWTVAGACGLRVQAAQLHHRVPCWGYVFQEPPRASNAEADSKTPGRKVVLLGDTHNSAAMHRIAYGADLVSHEATFLDGMYNKARIATHSTGSMAGAFARQVEAKQLVLTHFSSRYGHDDPDSRQRKPRNEEDEEAEVQQDLRQLQSQAERAMQSRNVACAFDGFTWRL